MRRLRKLRKSSGLLSSMPFKLFLCVAGGVRARYGDTFSFLFKNRAQLYNNSKKEFERIQSLKLKPDVFGGAAQFFLNPKELVVFGRPFSPGRSAGLNHVGTKRHG
ncbi:hypothetical protein MsAc7_05160 [Methanolapillus millepedarum]|uniref:Uncharacterized protein n=1 Tax=Methanolapillus millepedarum TaxID=3028296 RepID=A0AA96V1Z3_9EURY|nr:hypothetical protein MsAc7_05160 [Methanosarcinaceae archaeon Ac7]